MSLYLKLQTQKHEKRVYRILKVHTVSSFAPRISGLHTFGRKQRFLAVSSLLNHVPRDVRLNLAKDLIQNRRGHAFA